ncbi:DNA damage-binding protein 1 isoform X2, partial [Tanacetum coccineum]
LVKLNVHPDAKGSYVEVLERYVNLGPIVDFCVVDLERQGQGQVVTCSGAFKDGSLRIVRNGIGINEQASVELQGTSEGKQKLRFHSLVGRRCLSHDAVHIQLVQVTSSSVRLVSSITRELKHEWHAPADYSINVATANTTQVLLATRGGHLVYLEIVDGLLVEKKHAQLEYDVSCLDINPIGDNPNYSNLAAVGMWTGISVRIFSLPDLTLKTEEHLGGEIIPRSVLLCAFEGIPYLLCALGDGHLLNFLLNTTTGQLTDRKKVSLGTQPITLKTFSSKSTTHVFAASDRPTVIYSSNKKLLYSNVNLKEVSYMCPFNSAAFPDSFITFLSLGGHAETYAAIEEQSRTFAICSLKYNQSSTEDSEMHFIRLLDDQTFDFISSYSLDQFEYGCSILSCSFSDDNNAYYCVGTAYVMPEENEPTKVR